MKALGSKKALGLAVGERSLAVAELAPAAAGAEARVLAEFVYPAGLSLDDPAALGKALRQFLQSNRVGTKNAVVGVPLKWALVRPKEVPPAEPALTAGLLRMQAEREFALEPQELVVDFVGESDPTGPRTVLLIAARRPRVAAVEAMADAAGLNVQAVTLSATALGAEAGRSFGRDAMVLHVAPGAAELAVQSEGRPRVLRHFRAPGAAPEAAAAEGAPIAPAMLPGEVRRVLSMMPRNGAGAPDMLLVWDGVAGDLSKALTNGSNLSVRDETLSSLGVSSPLPKAEAARFAPAVALALTGMRGERPAVDFIHSRLVAPKENKLKRPIIWASIAGAAAAVLGILAITNLARDRSEIDGLQKQLGDMQKEVKAAEASIARIGFAEGWFRREPRYLALARDLTTVFPDDGQVWATSLVLKDEAPSAQNGQRSLIRGTLTGRASTERAAAIPTLLKKTNGKFFDVKTLDIRAVGKDSKETTFSISFAYAGESQP